VQSELEKTIGTKALSFLAQKNLFFTCTKTRFPIAVEAAINRFLEKKICIYYRSSSLSGNQDKSFFCNLHKSENQKKNRFLPKKRFFSDIPTATKTAINHQLENYPLEDDLYIVEITSAKLEKKKIIFFDRSTDPKKKKKQQKKNN
jgi:hypothetical protein